MMIEHYIRHWHRHKEQLTSERIDFIAQVIAIEVGDDSGFAAYVTRQRIQAIQAAEGESKVQLACAFLDFLVEGFARQKRFGQTIYYTRWKVGKAGLTGGTVGVCPVCGRKGVLNPPDAEYDFGGSTTHIVKPFFMGEEILDSCDWNPQAKIRMMRLLVEMGDADEGKP